MAKKLYIIDGHAHIYSAYYAPMRPLTGPTGEPTKAVFVFTNILLGLLDRQKPDMLVVTMDSPAWNFHVARAAHDLGIPVLYYIVPQLWAWGAWRVKKLRRCTDRLACILPLSVPVTRL